MLQDHHGFDPTLLMLIPIFILQARSSSYCRLDIALVENNFGRKVLLILFDHDDV
jgi:hypothetical protein